MTETARYFDGNWNPVTEEAHAAFRLVTVYDADGVALHSRRESLGERKDRVTYSTDPRAGGIMREGHRTRPMSRPVD